MKVFQGSDSASASMPWTQHFTGTAWMDLLLREPMARVEGNVVMTTVTFTPGVRTHWHRHDGGQILLVVAGQGWVGSVCGTGSSPSAVKVIRSAGPRPPLSTGT